MARLLTIALSLSAAACENPFSASSADQLEDAREKWSRERIASYSFTVRVGCFCPGDTRGPFRVTVSNGAVTSITDPATGAPRAASRFVPLTVEALFARVQQAIDDGVEELDVRYHAELGYPVTIEINLSQQPVDGGVVITASDLVRAP
jgi:hypothetical protein